MRILLDHNVPVPLRYALHDHEVETAFERAWEKLLNGELITAAEQAGFDLLIRTDRGLSSTELVGAQTIAPDPEYERLGAYKNGQGSCARGSKLHCSLSSYRAE
jgi:hypothetical protein